MILVTGASGYLGSHITRRLVENGSPVRAMVRNRQYAEAEGRLAGLDIQWVEADVTKPQTLIPAFENISSVIHTVAIAIEKPGLEYDIINYEGTVNVVEAAKSTGTERLINISQLGADPSLPYRFLASKGKAQEYVARSDLNWTAFRPSVIWGPEDEFANTFAKLIPLTPLIFPIIGDDDARFQPVWVEDLVTCVVKSLEDPNTIGKEYEIGGPEVLTLEEIEHRTMQALGANRLMIHFPMPILRTAVSMMEAMLPSPPVTKSLLELLAVENVTKNNSINQFVPEPTPFKPEFTAPYMQQFSVKQTLAQFFNR